MLVEMKMPDLATTESPITIVRWLVETGQKVRRGQPLVEVETDKATMEAESIASGILKSVAVEPGAQVDVGDLIATIEDGRSEDKKPANSPAEHDAAPSNGVAAPPTRASAQDAPRRPGGMFARNRQQRAGDASSQEQTTSTADVVALSPTQRTAARRLQASKQTVPHFYLQTSIDADALVNSRNGATEPKPAWDAFLIWAAARALASFPRMAMRWQDDALAVPDKQDINVAVDHDGDLFVVPIHQPAGKTVNQISEQLRDVVRRLREGDTQVRRVEPACMTITNLGMCNVESFVPIINAPETTILAAGKIMRQPVVQENRIEIHSCWNLTLAVDHRVVNGKYAGQFLGRIAELLEIFDGSTKDQSP